MNTSDRTHTSEDLDDNDDEHTNIDNKKEKTNSYANLNDVNMLRNALEYYDNNQDKFNKISDNFEFYKLETSNSNIEHNKIYFYDKHENEIASYKYEMTGIYDPQTHLWTWGWAIPTLKKNLSNIIKKILLYGSDLETTSLFLKSELVNSRFYISNPIQLEIHCAVASYLAKRPFVYGLKTFFYSYRQNNKISLTKPIGGEDNKHIYQYIFLF